MIVRQAVDRLLGANPKNRPAAAQLREDCLLLRNEHNEKIRARSPQATRLDAASLDAPYTDEERDRLKETALSAMTEAELWRWHSLDYAWRRVWMGPNPGPSPLDPHGKWYHPKLVRLAEEYERRRKRRGARPPDHIVRPDYDQLAVRDWTLAELAIENRKLDEKAIEAGFCGADADDDTRRMARAAFVKSTLGARQDQWGRAFADQVKVAGSGLSPAYVSDFARAPAREIEESPESGQFDIGDRKPSAENDPTKEGNFPGGEEPEF